MIEPTKLVLQDVRCFEGVQRGRLHPITLLVGENSTGKTTFMACFSVIHRWFSGFVGNVDDLPDFNRAPFSLGSFRDIVRSRLGPSGPINEFRVGLEFPQDSENGQPTEVLVTFEEQGLEPNPVCFLYRFGPADYIEFRRIAEDRVAVSTPVGELEGILRSSSPWRYGLEFLMYQIVHSKSSSATGSKKTFAYVRRFGRSRKVARNPTQLFGLPLGAILHSSLVPIAPLRAKPKRTYNPVRETDSPGGEYVPMLMMRLNHSDKREWQSLHEQLIRFGKESGLYSDIKVRRHGRQIGDPFQLQVKALSSSHANIMDVGYGVSQSLPILVSLLSGFDHRSFAGQDGRENRTFLLQQPEVHLHPRGQAELAELFARVAVSGHDRFLIETHSDYIIDRIRILVRKKLVRPDDVSIIFFEPKRNSALMHNISLDEFGNLQNAPPSYRSFFLKETDRLLGFDD